jgi:hypothetical protein
MIMNKKLLMVLLIGGCPVVQGANGLDEADRSIFYHLEEGSEVIPFALVKPLRRPSGEPFLSNLDRFGLIPDPNPSKLPIGMTLAPTRDTRIFGNVEMIGINCAACHVNEITFEGRRLLIDGAPNRFDIEAFFRELAESVTNTLDPRSGELIPYLLRLASGSDHTLRAI